MEEGCLERRVDPYIFAKEPYIFAKEPYIFAKEPYISVEEPIFLPRQQAHLTGGRERAGWRKDASNAA